MVLAFFTVPATPMLMALDRCEFLVDWLMPIFTMLANIIESRSAAVDGLAFVKLLLKVLGLTKIVGI